MTGAPDRALQLERVSKSFSRHRALVDVSMELRAGEVTAILGPNGAGKSTLLAILSTLAQPTAGRISYAGEAIARGTALRTRIGYVGHEPGLYGDLTARQNLTLFAALYGLADPAPRIEQMLARVGLGDVRGDAIVRTFSRGMQQRLSLARALLPEPEILLFDEPGSALDPTGAAWLSTELRRERDGGRLVVLVTHDLDAAASVATHLVILRRGRVVLDERRASGFSPEAVRTLYAERTHAAS